MYILDCWKRKLPYTSEHVPEPVTVSLPARFDFIGGWTDTPPYYFENEARVLNATLTLPGANALSDAGAHAITVTVQPAERLTIRENGQPVNDLSEHIVIRKTLDFLGLSEPPIHLTITNSIPKGSGLGGSSLLTAAVLAAIQAHTRGITGVSSHLRELVNNVLFIEQLMESGGGWQDQIGGMFPGVKLIGVSPEKPCEYSIRYCALNMNELNRRSLIIDTRVQRRAARILYSIRQKYLERDPETIRVLSRIAVNATLGFDLLDSGNITDFARLLSESWEMVNSVECGSIERVEQMKRLCGRDLLGMKIGGAGGGGFMLAIFSEPDIRNYYRDRIRAEFPECLAYEPVFGGPGLALVHDTPADRRITPIGRQNLSDNFEEPEARG